MQKIQNSICIIQKFYKEIKKFTGNNTLSPYTSYQNSHEHHVTTHDRKCTFRKSHILFPTSGPPPLVH